MGNGSSWPGADGSTLPPRAAYMHTHTEREHNICIVSEAEKHITYKRSEAALMNSGEQLSARHNIILYDGKQDAL